MALRLGIGDVFTLCKGTVDICKAIHDEPKEVQSTVASMKLMRAHLMELESKIGDEKSFAAARPDIAPIIKRSLEPLHRDLLDVRETLHHCTRKQSVHVADKVRYLVLYKAKLEGFRDKLSAHRESISTIQELIEHQSQSDRRASTVKLCQILESHEREQKQQDEYNRAQKEVVEMFEERLPSTGNGRHLSTREMLEELEEDMIGKGLTQEKVQERLFPITKALLLQPLPTKPSPTTTQLHPFNLHIFEPKSHTVTENLYRSRSKDRSGYENASTAELDAKVALSENLSIPPDCNDDP